MLRDYELTISAPGTTVWEGMQSASSARLNYPLNGISTLDLAFDAASPDAQAIYTGLATHLPVVTLARSGTVVFTGPLKALDMTVGETGEISASFTDWAGVLESWSPYGTYKAQSADTIVSGLLALNRWPAGLSGLTRSGSVSATASVSRAEQSTVFEEIVEAATVAPFDWYVNHSAHTFVMGSTLGTDKSASVLVGVGDIPGAHTIANGQSARVTYQPPLNTVWATSGKGKTYSSTGAASVTAYGQCWGQVDAGNSNAQAFANARRRDLPRQIVEITTDPQVAPAWLTDYWLGDTISVSVASRALALSGDYRVNNISVDLNESMTEVANTLTFEVV